MLWPRLHMTLAVGEMLNKNLLRINLLHRLANKHVNSLYSGGFAHTDKHNKDEIVFIYFKGSHVDISKLLYTLVPEVCIYLSKQCRP